MQGDRRDVRDVPRTWFAQWGLPTARRLDHGFPWGSGHDLPPALALWLLGLGIALVGHRPRHKHGHAVIERAHGVCQRWVEPGTCQRPDERQARLDSVTTLQRERYPLRAEQSRLALYPALATGGRPDDPATAEIQWDERRVWAFLAQQVFPRRVDKVGRISLANRAVGVGRAWAGTTVTVRRALAAGAPVWRIRDGQGQDLRQQPVPALSRERILALDVSHHRPERRRPVKPRVHQQGHPYAR